MARQLVFADCINAASEDTAMGWEACSLSGSMQRSVDEDVAAKYFDDVLFVSQKMYLR